MATNIGKRIFEQCFDLLFPPTCVGCRKEGVWLCALCNSFLKVHANARCPFCKKPSFRGFLCIWCREQHALTQVVATFFYDDFLRRIIHSIKFGFVSACIPELGKLAADAWQLYGSNEQWRVIPIPLHKRRLAERGFNQSALLAKEIVRILGFEYCDDALVRQQQTLAQAELSREERLRNVEGAFSCRMAERVSGAQVLLIDDVFTSGATLNEAARVLRVCGAREIRALTLAHG